MIDAEAEQVVGAQARRTLTDGEIASNTVNLIAAGYETTANALAYTSYLLALHPSVQDRLHSEIEEYFENNPVSGRTFVLGIHVILVALSTGLTA